MNCQSEHGEMGEKDPGSGFAKKNQDLLQNRNIWHDMEMKRTKTRTGNNNKGNILTFNSFRGASVVFRNATGWYVRLFLYAGVLEAGHTCQIYCLDYTIYIT